jgi:hypothetical protein
MTNTGTENRVIEFIITAAGLPAPQLCSITTKKQAIIRRRSASAHLSLRKFSALPMAALRKRSLA